MGIYISFSRRKEFWSWLHNDVNVTLVDCTHKMIKIINLKKIKAN